MITLIISGIYSMNDIPILPPPTKIVLSVKTMLVSGSSIGLSFVEWLPFWLRIITMICTIAYIIAKTYKVLKD